MKRRIFITLLGGGGGRVAAGGAGAATDAAGDWLPSQRFAYRVRHRS